jgi:hypothetical protein
MTPARAAQHLLGQFSSFEGRLISEELLNAAIAKSTGASGRLDNHTYVHGWDLARKQTFTVGVVLDISVKPYQVVHVERYQRDWPKS